MLARVHALVRRRPGTVLLVALLLSLPMGWWSAELFGDVRADIKELLPENARSVVTLRNLERRFGGYSKLSVVIESPDREANRRFSDDLVQALSGHPLVHSIKNKVTEERAFFERNRALFVDLEDLETILERIEDAANDARRRANPLLVDLEDKPKVELDLSDIERKYAGQADAVTRFAHDYYENADGTEQVVLVRQSGLGFGIAKNQELVAATEAAIAKLDPKRYHPQLVTGLGNEVKNLVEEQQTLIEDLVTASLIVAIMLAAVIVAYYRRLRAVLLLSVPVLVGTIATFGVGHFMVGHLNASSAFLIPIIPGNGINFGLILLARFLELRRERVDTDIALGVAMKDTLRGTSTAAFAAAISYGSLIATDFQGFRHFGLVGGVGMVLCWLSTFTVLPAMILWTERVKPMPTEDKIHVLPPGSISAIPARWVARLPLPFALAGAGTGLLAAVLTAGFLRDPFEKDFNKLRNTDSATRGSAYWDQKMDAIFGRYLTPQVVIAEKEEDVPAIVAALEKVVKDGGPKGPISDVVALTKLVPKRQEEKIAVLKKIRAALSDDLLANLDEAQRERALALRPPEDLAPFGAKDLPEAIRGELRERDGREGLVVLAVPNVALNLYHADEIHRVAEALREIPLPDGRKVESSGTFVIYDDMVSSVAHDGPRATLYSFAGVVLLCLVAFRARRSVLVVLSTLLVGVAWLGVCFELFDLRINFLNFIALPITFGIGVDYAVNIYSRFLIERETHGTVEAARHTIVSTGGAVTLCSLTTVIGYASLLIARNGALISFGKVAILGEVTTLVAALLVMPAWLMAWGRRDPQPAATLTEAGSPTNAP